MCDDGYRLRVVSIPGIQALYATHSRREERSVKRAKTDEADVPMYEVTCPQCNKVGKECNALAQIHGGGACSTNADCGNFGPDKRNPLYTGGKCEGGVCVCFDGYTCPHCSTSGNPESVAKGDLVCNDGASAVTLTFATLLSVLVFIAYHM